MVRRATDFEAERRALRLATEALERPAEERATWLDGACGATGALRERVERLLSLHGAALAPLEWPTDAGVPRLPAGGPGAGERVGPWELVECIGRGGMGEVWRARRADGEYAREVALKLVLGGFATRDLGRRFERERQALARLRHAHVATLYDGGVDDGRAWLAMELVGGAPIDEHCEREGLGLDARVGLFLDVARAVEHAHAALVLHRDIKPSNVLVEPDGRAVLLDFGIARLLSGPDDEPEDLTGPSQRVLTPRYASPEALRGEPPTTATDVWSLGVLLHELVTGVHPFDGAAAADRLARVEAGPAELPSRLARRAGRREAGRLSGDLDTILAAALHPDAERRTRTAGALVADLERWRRGLPVAARPDTWAYRASKFVRRHRAAVAAALLVSLTLAGALAWSLRLLARMREARDDALSEQRVQRELLSQFQVLLRAANPSVRAASPDGAAVTLAEALEVGLEHLEGRYPDQPRIEGCLRAEIGAALRGLGRVESGRRELARAADLLAASLGPDHPETLAARVELAVTDGQLGRSLACLESLEELVPRLERAPDARPADVLHARAALADALGHAGRAAEGRRAIEALLPECERVLGARHPYTAYARAVEAALVLSGEDVGASVELARRSLNELVATVGERHVQTALAHYALASALYNAGRYDGAEPHAEAAVRSLSELQAPGAVDLLRARLLRASLHCFLGRAERAEAELRALLPWVEGAGEGSVLALRARELLTQALAAQGRVAEVEEAQRELVAFLRELPAEVGRLHTALHNLAATLYGEGRYEEAEPLYAEALEVADRSLGRDHYQTWPSLSGRASCLLVLDRVDEALVLLRDLVERSAVAYERGESDHALRGRVTLANALLRTGDFREAVEVSADVVEHAERLHPEGSPVVHYYRAALAYAELHVARSPDALARLEAAADALGAELGPLHAYTVWARACLERLPEAPEVRDVRTEGEGDAP